MVMLGVVGYLSLLRNRIDTDLFTCKISHTTTHDLEHFVGVKMVLLEYQTLMGCRTSPLLFGTNKSMCLLIFASLDLETLFAHNSQPIPQRAALRPGKPSGESW